MTRQLPGVDLLRLPVPLHPEGATYAAASVVIQVRFDRPPTDDEVVDVRVVVLDSDGDEHDVGAAPAPEAPDAVQASAPWISVTVPIDDLAPLRRGSGADETLVLVGWGLRGLPPRATADVDALLAVDGGLGEGDLVIRGGDGTVAGAGRLYVSGLRTFIEHDWRYGLQPDLPDPEPLQRPPAGPDAGPAGRHVVYLDVWERSWHRFQDRFLAEDALPGEETAFRTRKVTQVRVLPIPADGVERLPTPTGDGRLTTNVAFGELPDRFPPETPDPCRDRCLFTENAATGEGYTGSGEHPRARRGAGATPAARPSSAGRATTPPTWSRWSSTRSRVRSPCSSRPRTPAPSPPGASSWSRTGAAGSTRGGPSTAPRCAPCAPSTRPRASSSWSPPVGH